jgi:hypothetical protein
MALKEFIKALLKHWWALMGCAAFTFLGVIVLWREKTNKWALGATIAMAVIMLLVASYLAWLDQYHKANPIEPNDSLRRQTKQLADDIDLFTSGRAVILRNITGNDQDPLDPKRRQHDQETDSQYVQKFRNRVAGIENALKGAGLHLGLNYDLGEQLQVLKPSEVEVLRCMAYRLDHAGKVVEIKSVK